jgi:hypothetical protein
MPIPKQYIEKDRVDCCINILIDRYPIIAEVIPIKLIQLLSRSHIHFREI